MFFILCAMQLVVFEDNSFGERPPDPPPTATATVKPQCPTCEHCTVCLESLGVCVPSGQKECPSGRCTQSDDCDCPGGCDSCSQKCNTTSHQCEERDPKMKICEESGQCEPADFCGDCSRVCDACEEKCMVNPDCPVLVAGTLCDINTCQPNTNRKRCSETPGSCIPSSGQCPSECNPPCFPCTQYCSNGTSCVDTDMMLCPEGSCVSKEKGCLPWPR
jgi:hypothetical protein